MAGKAKLIRHFQAGMMRADMVSNGIDFKIGMILFVTILFFVTSYIGWRMG